MTQDEAEELRMLSGEFIPQGIVQDETEELKALSNEFETYDIPLLDERGRGEKIVDGIQDFTTGLGRGLSQVGLGITQLATSQFGSPEEVEFYKQQAQGINTKYEDAKNRSSISAGAGSIIGEAIPYLVTPSSSLPKLVLGSGLIGGLEYADVEEGDSALNHRLGSAGVSAFGAGIGGVVEKVASPLIPAIKDLLKSGSGTGGPNRLGRAMDNYLLDLDDAFTFRNRLRSDGTPNRAPTREEVSQKAATDFATDFNANVADAENRLIRGLSTDKLNKAADERLVKLADGDLGDLGAAYQRMPNNYGSFGNPRAQKLEIENYLSYKPQDKVNVMLSRPERDAIQKSITDAEVSTARKKAIKQVVDLYPEDIGKTINKAVKPNMSPIDVNRELKNVINKSDTASLVRRGDDSVGSYTNAAYESMIRGLKPGSESGIINDLSNAAVFDIMTGSGGVITAASAANKAKDKALGPVTGRLDTAIRRPSARTATAFGDGLSEAARYSVPRASAAGANYVEGDLKGDSKKRLEDIREYLFK